MSHKRTNYKQIIDEGDYVTASLKANDTVRRHFPDGVRAKVTKTWDFNDEYEFILDEYEFILFKTVDTGYCQSRFCICQTGWAFNKDFEKAQGALSSEELKMAKPLPSVDEVASFFKMKEDK